MERTEQCGKCRWWEEYSPEDYGEGKLAEMTSHLEHSQSLGRCKRFPPAQIIVQSVGEGIILAEEADGDLSGIMNYAEYNFDWCFPVTITEDYCGEFAAQPPVLPDWKTFRRSFSIRTRNVIDRMSIVSVQDLCSRSEEDFLSQRNFGEISAHEIRYRLRKYSLRLKLDQPTPG